MDLPKQVIDGAAYLLISGTITAIGYRIAFWSITRALESFSRSVNQKIDDMKAGLTEKVEAVHEKVGSVDEKLSHQIEAYHACQKELPKTYAAKDHVARLFERTDRLESDVSFLKGFKNGSAAKQVKGEGG